ncbi:hypothetical protein [Candidatus Phytoplasma sp. AldY-WA1]|uniref:hypothetical protein n=1 Tax=Candidatus Phytoplasma sp. AldY-WA1 TaxID=2852100 RepID=UPI00255067A9|nr:hypothetical protein [Candidatus Phytoplasma sp. AldY-WA1]
MKRTNTIKITTCSKTILQVFETFDHNKRLQQINNALFLAILSNEKIKIFEKYGVKQLLYVFLKILMEKI